MANVYHATTNDGSTHEVTTPQHHEGQSDSAFRKHLLDVILKTTSGVLATAISHYTFKGRR